MMLLDNDGFNLNKLISNYNKICHINEMVNNYKGVSKNIYDSLKKIAPNEVYGLDEKVYTEEMSGSQYRETTAVIERLKSYYTDNLKEISLKSLQSNISRITNLILIQSNEIPNDIGLCTKGRDYIVDKVDVDTIKSWRITINDEDSLIECYNSEIISSDAKISDFKLEFKINIGVTSDPVAGTLEYSSIDVTELLRLCGIVVTNLSISSIISCGLVNPQVKVGGFTSSRFDCALTDCLIEYFKQILRVQDEFGNYNDLKSMLDEIADSVNNDSVFTAIREYQVNSDVISVFKIIISIPFLDVFHVIINNVKKVIAVENSKELIIDDKECDSLSFAVAVSEFKNALYSISIINAWMLFIDSYITNKNNLD